jgi:hypothetical protein
MARTVKIRGADQTHCTWVFTFQFRAPPTTATPQKIHRTILQPTVGGAGGARPRPLNISEIPRNPARCHRGQLTRRRSAGMQEAPRCAHEDRCVFLSCGTSAANGGHHQKAGRHSGRKPHSVGRRPCAQVRTCSLGMIRASPPCATARIRTNRNED